MTAHLLAWWNRYQDDRRRMAAQREARKAAIRSLECSNCHRPLFMGERAGGLCVNCQPSRPLVDYSKFGDEKSGKTFLKEED